jgi:hypothetical protein
MPTIGQAIKVSGFVVDETNQPLIEVIVTNGNESTTTDDKGYFLLTYNYTDTKNIITFFRIGFESQTVDIALETGPDIEFIRSIVMKSSAVLSGVEIRNFKANRYFINGFVVDESGKAIEGAAVKLEYFDPIIVPELPTLNIPVPALPALPEIPTTELRLMMEPALAFIIGLMAALVRLKTDLRFTSRT